MRQNKNNLRQLAALAIAGTAIIAGARYASDRLVPDAQASERIEPSQANDTFSAELKPVQTQGPVTGTSGTVTAQATSDAFMVVTDARGFAQNVEQAQFIQLGSRCPVPADDTNGDGWIDAQEAAAASGKPFIPLDGDLSKQTDTTTATPGNEPDQTPGDFPKSDSRGDLRYAEIANLSDTLNDLRQPDSDTSDDLAKLGANDQLDLEARTVIIYGVPANESLPDSVKPLKGFTAQASLPVACGELNRQVAGGRGVPMPPPAPPDVGPSPGPSPGVSPGPSASPSASPSPSPTATPSPTPTATPRSSPTATPTATPKSSPTATPRSSPTATPSGSPKPKPTPKFPPIKFTPRPTPPKFPPIKFTPKPFGQ